MATKSPRRNRLNSLAAAIFVVTVTTLLSMLLGRVVSHRVSWLLYLIAVCLIAARSDAIMSSIASVLSLIAFDFFIEPPLYDFFITDFETFFTFVVVLGIAVFVGWRTQIISDLQLAKTQAESTLAALQIRELETAKQQAESALEAKTKFLATVGHEVRTPMVGIIGLVELLCLKDLGPDVNPMVRTAFDSSKRLLQTLNCIVDAAKLEAGKIQLEYRPFPIRPVVSDVAQLISRDAENKQLRLSVSCDKRLPEYVCGDELRVRQVLFNLGCNAVKFTEQGEIYINADLVEEDGSKTTVGFSVIDTGIGISQQQQADLFQPFTQVQDTTTSVAGGTGLGLSISKDLVELMGGQISVTSQPGNGSRFCCEIPFFKDQYKS